MAPAPRRCGNIAKHHPTSRITALALHWTGRNAFFARGCSSFVKDWHFMTCVTKSCFSISKDVLVTTNVGKGCSCAIKDSASIGMSLPKLRVHWLPAAHQVAQDPPAHHESNSNTQQLPAVVPCNAGTQSCSSKATHGHSELQQRCQGPADTAHSRNRCCWQRWTSCQSNCDDHHNHESDGKLVVPQDLSQLLPIQLQIPLLKALELELHATLLPTGTGRFLPNLPCDFHMSIVLERIQSAGKEVHAAVLSNGNRS
mmetsp:Transcript_150041/g.261477  ORF Transcript_150041/g.261477 Transcript_150041/m.261477 type:complete len:256 (+) Transcript_150041:237-1004(+)